MTEYESLLDETIGLMLNIKGTLGFLHTMATTTDISDFDEFFAFKDAIGLVTGQELSRLEKYLGELREREKKIQESSDLKS